MSYLKHLALAALICIALLIPSLASAAPATLEQPSATVATGAKGTTLSVDTSVIGIGGHGAVFTPLFSPHDPDTLLAGCDMGGFYVSHDCGDTWDIHSIGGRVYVLEADPSTPGTFYAAGSGLWRSTDNGDHWSLIWPNPASITSTPSRVNHNRTYYFTTDSYPNSQMVEALAVDPQDPQHLVVLTAAGEDTNASYSRYVFESLDGGANFICLADYHYTKAFYHRTFLNNHVFVEHGSSSATSRIVISNPQGIFEVNRAATDQPDALTPLYEPSGTYVVIDVAQVNDSDGVHYFVLESQGAVVGTDVALWHTTDFSDPSKKVDLTSEFNQLPREYGPQADRGNPTPTTQYRLNKHAACLLSAPSLDRMYLTYHVSDYTDARSYWIGINGLVEYDATRPAGSRFFWVHGERLYWNGADSAMRITPNQNELMARAHSDASFLFFGIAVDPNDPKRILLGTHTSAVYSPNIDADVGQLWGIDKVNLYPKYATIVEQDANVSESRCKSNGLEVTVVQHVRTDPFDPKHLLIGMDDAGVAESHDGGETWRRLYTKQPSGASDTCWETVFDEGEEGVVYAAWDAAGSGAYYPSNTFLNSKGVFVTSTDGGTTWGTPATGLPDKASIVAIAVDYPRDATGAITSGERTIYVATMGYGFYVSHDSGVTFSSMNTGVVGWSHTWSGNTADVIWARDVLLTSDGRLFGMTSYSTLDTDSRYREQDDQTFGNVYEWDYANSTWVRLPFNRAGADISGINVRQPRSFAYDAKTRTLYVAGVCVIGAYHTDNVWDNFGGGLYTYKSLSGAAVGSGTVEAVDADSSVIGNTRGLTGVKFDPQGNLWVATEDGDIYLKNDEFNWVQVYSRLMRRCKDFDIATDGTLYLTTTGISALRIRPTFTAATPDTAASPATPVTAESPASPATPDTAQTPATADTPETAFAPESPATPSSPTSPSSPSTPAEPDEPTGWVWSDSVWQYRRDGGSYATGWVWDGSAWYLLVNEGSKVGVMQRNRWVWEAGNWYHLADSGAMDVGWMWDGGLWYWMNDNPNIDQYGAMWRNTWLLKGAWYLLGPDGNMLTGWQWGFDGWYYLNPDGSMLSSAWTPDGYWVDGTGRWVA